MRVRRISLVSANESELDDLGPRKAFFLLVPPKIWGKYFALAKMSKSSKI